jgi:ubiquinone/menaquinone biosynthesis C-methylase UbiE
MKGFKFDTEKLKHLNNPERMKDIPPEYIIEKMNLDHPETILDIGAGTGFFSNEFSKIKGIKKVYALDIADEMIQWMKENLAPNNNKIIPLKMQEDKIDLDDDLADAVIMINVHHEFHHPLRILNEVKRLLRSGGKVAIVDWAKRETEHGPPVEKRYTTKKIHSQLEQTSFKEIQVFEELQSHFLIVAGQTD